MLPASNRGAGNSVGFPDVCAVPATPPVPTPFPNVAMNAQATPFAATVFISMMNALNMASSIPMTSGDEAGSASPIKGAGRYTAGNPVVFVELMPAINLLCPTSGNNMVNPVGAVVVPSAVNVFYTLRRDEVATPEPGLSGDQLQALGAILDAPHPVSRGELHQGATGSIAISLFTLDVPTLLHAEITRLRALGMRALVLDLRGCPGGDLEAAIRLADDFLERGAVIATLTDSDGDDTTVRARQGDPSSFPLFLLVDRHTASAAELFAGALKAHGRAVILGERTYGKGTAQTVLAGFSEPGAHYATVATFALPDGAPVQGRGIHPDVAMAPESSREAILHAASALPSTSLEVL